MNSNDPKEMDPLRNVLQEWKVDAPLPPRFQEQVWRRIARHERRPSAFWLHDLWLSLEAAFRRPALAVSYVAILLLVGAGIGVTQARQEAVRMADTLGTRYVQTVDPYQASR